MLTFSLVLRCGPLADKRGHAGPREGMEVEAKGMKLSWHALVQIMLSLLTIALI
jgi:hypothetical protein